MKKKKKKRLGAHISHHHRSSRRSSSQTDVADVREREEEKKCKERELPRRHRCGRQHNIYIIDVCLVAALTMATNRQTSLSLSLSFHH